MRNLKQEANEIALSWLGEIAGTTHRRVVVKVKEARPAPLPAWDVFVRLEGNGITRGRKIATLIEFPPRFERGAQRTRSTTDERY